MLAQLLCRVPAGTVDTVLSSCPYSLNDQTLADMVPYLQGKGVGIINASALSMGLLTDQVRHKCSGTAAPALLITFADFWVPAAYTYLMGSCQLRKRR